MKPSQVFFGDSLINGVFPKKKPNKYAAISLMTISEAGRRNLNIKAYETGFANIYIKPTKLFTVE